MTYLEKFKLENPELSEEDVQKHVLTECPTDCNGHTIYCPKELDGTGVEDGCPICWNREIPTKEDVIE